MKERIKNLLINGLSASEISTVVGCSPSYISQLIKDEDFKREVNEGKMAAQASRTEEEHIDNRYQTLEHKILSSVEDSLAEATLGEKVRALEMIDKRTENRYRRKNPVPTTPGVAIQMNVVSLSLPAHAVAKNNPVIQMNEQSEIVAIDNKALAPMSSDGVKNLFSQISAAQQQKVLEEI